VKNIFAQLELRFGLIRETTPKYTQYQYKELSLPADNTPAGESIRKASKKAKTWTHIDVDAASRVKNVPRGTIIAKLNDWNERGYIQLDAKGVENVYLVLKPLPTSVQDRNALADSVYKELEIREQQDLARMDQVTDLITRKQCFALSLAKHFGDELPDKKQACGHCTWCETQQPVELKNPPKVSWDSKAFFKVLAAIPERDDPRFLARVAFGIGSPRVTSAKLGKSQVFGSMEDCSFVVCLIIPVFVYPDADLLPDLVQRVREGLRRVSLIPGASSVSCKPLLSYADRGVRSCCISAPIVGSSLCERYSIASSQRAMHITRPN
jgi:hypothetical protein